MMVALGRDTVVFKPVQSANAEVPILVASGRDTVARPVQPENAEAPMLVAADRVTEVRAAPENA
jgi:hypothetical protein